MVFMHACMALPFNACSTWKLLNARNLFQRMHLAPGTRLTFASIITMNLIANSEGFFQLLITGSPGSTIVYQDVLVRRLVCPPLNNSVANVLHIPRPAVETAPELLSAASNRAEISDEPYCYASTHAIPPTCNRPYVFMREVAGAVALTEGHVAGGGQGGYNLYYVNQTYVCMRPVGTWLQACGRVCVWARACVCAHAAGLVCVCACDCHVTMTVLRVSPAAAHSHPCLI